MKFLAALEIIELLLFADGEGPLLAVLDFVEALVRLAWVKSGLAGAHTDVAQDRPHR